MSRGGSGRHGRSASGALQPSRQPPVGLGISNKFGSAPFPSMGTSSSASKLSSDERFLASLGGRVAYVSGATRYGNNASGTLRPFQQEELPIEMTEEQAMTKITDDLKEFFAARNLDEAEVYFTTLPAVHHFRLVDKLTSSAVEQKEADVQLVADFFNRAISKELVSGTAIEDGLTPTTAVIEDIAIDAPKALAFLAMIINATGLAEDRQITLAFKSTASEELLPLLSDLSWQELEARRKEHEIKQKEEKEEELRKKDDVVRKREIEVGKHEEEVEKRGEELRKYEEELRKREEEVKKCKEELDVDMVCARLFILLQAPAESHSRKSRVCENTKHRR